MAGIWTEEREQAVRMLFNTGASAREIAADVSQQFGFKVSRNAIIGLWGRRNWPLGERQRKTKTPRPPRQADKLEKRERVRIIAAPKPAEPQLNKTIQKLMPTAHGNFRLIDTIAQEHGVAPLRSVDVVPLHVSLLELRPGQCRYPFGDAAPFSFCGCQVKPGKPYCSAHAALCGTVYANATEHERRSDALKRRWAHKKQMEAAE